MKRYAIGFAVLFGLWHGEAKAGFATARVVLNGTNNPQAGDYSASASGSYADTNGSQSGFATAQGMPGANGVLVTGGSRSNNISHTVYTEAAWKDTLTLSGSPGIVLPDYVDLVFHAQGTISLPGFGTGSISVGGGGGGDGFLSTYSYGPNSNIIEQVTVAGSHMWDDIQFGGGSFSGTWHLRLSLELPDQNGNRSSDWNVGYSTLLNPPAANYSGAINGDDPPTFSFTAVRLLDGRTVEEAGLSLSFGSGITSPNVANVTATPAPPGLVLMASGAAVPLFGWLLRRRRLTAPSTAS